MLKRHYSRFLAARRGRLHFAAHSHHLWPDVTREAALRAWDDAARLADRKWEHVFGVEVPKAQAHVARILDLAHPGQVAFGPSTHELVLRVLSCLAERGRLRILTTDAEFLSFARQAARLEELAQVQVRRVPVFPFESFEERFAQAAAREPADFVYFSQVFYDSGLAVADPAALAAAVRDPEALVVVDGYHGFLALPTSLAALEPRAFYTAGGYKYAMSGEGICLLTVPPGFRLRPLSTGWFARFGRLSETAAERVEFPDDGFRFWGATFDPGGLYRFNAVQDWLLAEGVSVDRLHGHVRALQDRFLRGLERERPSALPLESLVGPRSLERRGHFLAFRLEDAADTQRRLGEVGIDLDRRGDRLRFGFGVYQDEQDVDDLLGRLRAL